MSRVVKMSRLLSPTQQKIAEKLTILNDRCTGILTRIYNIKKVSGGSKKEAVGACWGRSGRGGRGTVKGCTGSVAFNKCSTDTSSRAVLWTHNTGTLKLTTWVGVY